MFPPRTVIKWVAVVAAAVILVAMGRAVWRYSETAFALTAEPPRATSAPTGTPDVAIGLPFRAVEIRADAGSIPAWQMGSGNRWLVSIPADGGGTADGHRVAPAATRAGLTVLEVSPRPRPDGTSIPYAGAWRDVHAAVRYAVRQGAEVVTLCAFGNGAVAVVQFLTESEFAEIVDSIILDGAPLDLNDTVTAGLKTAGIPGYLARLAKDVAAFRYDIHWADLDLTDRLEESALPVLILQGADDGFARPEVARSFAERAGSQVRYTEVAGAAHLQAAEADPATYDAALLEFLTTLTEAGAEGS